MHGLRFRRALSPSLGVVTCASRADARQLSHRSARTDLVTDVSAAVWNIVIKNNVFAYFPSIAIVEDQSFSMWKGLMVLDNNDWFHAGSPAVVGQYRPVFANEPLLQWARNLPAEQHGIEAEPRFVNLGTGDFHPGTGSPLINAGANLINAGVVLDFDRNPRPATGAFDIGAFQHK